MTKKASSAREVVEQFGGVNKIPKPVQDDLLSSFSLATASFFAKTWTERLDQEIKNGGLAGTDIRVVEYFESRDAFEEAKKAAQAKRATKALRIKLANAFWELKGAAEKLEIPTRVSKTVEM